MADAWTDADRSKAADALRDAAREVFRKPKSQQHRFFRRLIESWERRPDAFVSFADLASTVGIEEDEDPEHLKLHGLKYRIDRRLEHVARIACLDVEVESARGDGYRLVVERVSASGMDAACRPAAIEAPPSVAAARTSAIVPEARRDSGTRWSRLPAVAALALITCGALAVASRHERPREGSELVLEHAHGELIARSEGRAVARWSAAGVQRLASATRRPGAPRPASAALDPVAASKAYCDEEGNVRLLVPVSQTGLADGASLLVLDDEGSIAARIPALSDRTSVGHVHEPMIADFWLSGDHVWLVDPGAGAPLMIVTVFTNVPSDPTRIACIDATTLHPIGEYWNAGHVSAHGLHDCDGDGIQELLLGVSHNGYREGAFVVLDLLEMRGQSPSLGCEGYAFIGVPAGTQRHYVRFPRASATADRGDINAPVGVQALDGMIHVQVAEHVPNADGYNHYYLDPMSAELERFVLSDAVARANQEWLRTTGHPTASRAEIETTLARTRRWSTAGAWEDRVLGETRAKP